jgi:regulator of protease activity HflC (stomatin/prohibitin superfamily)
MFLGLAKALGVFAIVEEKQARVFVLFGEILGVLDKPGIYFLWPIRSIPVNSEEGTPMGIGVWYEMFITDPVAHIFRNVDPQGSLTANVKNATIKCLSNMPLLEMLVNRHQMSGLVREEVSQESAEWGYKLGSVYIRKVHFRDENMIKQIEEKVVNQLRQVTSAIEQDGKNQVNVIASKAEQEASVEFAKAAAMRPQIVAATLDKISKDPKVLATMFEIFEYEKVLAGDNVLTIIPKNTPTDLLGQLEASKSDVKI